MPLKDTLVNDTRTRGVSRVSGGRVQVNGENTLCPLCHVGAPWLVQRSRWESRPLSLVGNSAGAVTFLVHREGSVFPRGTGRFLVIKGVHVASFRCLSEEITSLFFWMPREHDAHIPR